MAGCGRRRPDALDSAGVRYRNVLALERLRHSPYALFYRMALLRWLERSAFESYSAAQLERLASRISPRSSVLGDNSLRTRRILSGFDECLFPRHWVPRNNSISETRAPDVLAGR